MDVATRARLRRLANKELSRSTAQRMLALANASCHYYARSCGRIGLSRS
jgi:hypothetical protein